MKTDYINLRLFWKPMSSSIAWRNFMSFGANFEKKKKRRAFPRFELATPSRKCHLRMSASLTARPRAQTAGAVKTFTFHCNEQSAYFTARRGKPNSYPYPQLENALSYCFDFLHGSTIGYAVLNVNVPWKSVYADQPNWPTNQNWKDGTPLVVFGWLSWNLVCRSLLCVCMRL